MWHKFEYFKGKEVFERNSYMVVTGEDPQRTAMAKTVGLPIGIATKLILQGKIKNTGVVIPTAPDYYIPILKALEQYNIGFYETEECIKKLNKNP